MSDDDLARLNPRILRRRKQRLTSSTSSSSLISLSNSADDLKRSVSDGARSPAHKKYKEENEIKVFTGFAQNDYQDDEVEVSAKRRMVQVVAPVSEQQQMKQIVKGSAATTPSSFARSLQEIVDNNQQEKDGDNGPCRNSSYDRSNPLPLCNWADTREVWSAMQAKERAGFYNRDGFLFQHHPCLHERMRSILIDWLIEVCEVYKLHRETLHLAIDFNDRYLSRRFDVPKSQLQLVGVTALFIAAKIEEIYPPKLSEFSFISDGACTEDEILEQEVIMLQVLKWNLAPLTVVTWLQMYLQILGPCEENDDVENFLYPPRYNNRLFLRTARLLDLCMLDFGSLVYQYSIIAASALRHMTSEKLALHLSGYRAEDIDECVKWMIPFVNTLEAAEATEQELDLNSPESGCEEPQRHIIQIHNVNIMLLDQAQQAQHVPAQSLYAPPQPVAPAPCTQIYIEALTPPKSAGSKGQRYIAHGQSPLSVDCARLCLHERSTTLYDPNLTPYTSGEAPSDCTPLSSR